MDVTEYRKGKTLLARLYGSARLGTFTSFQQMKVTDEGRAAGYTDFTLGEMVTTPWARQQSLVHTQLPVRQGVLYRILLGSSKAYRSAKSEQQNLLCLSLVEKDSQFGPKVLDPRFPATKQGCKLPTLPDESHGDFGERDFFNLKVLEHCEYLLEMSHDETYWEGSSPPPEAFTPLTMKNFAWNLSSPQYTRGVASMWSDWRSANMLWGIETLRTAEGFDNSESSDDDDVEPNISKWDPAEVLQFKSFFRAQVFHKQLNQIRINKLAVPAPFQYYELAAQSIATFALPAVATAAASAKRAAKELESPRVKKAKSKKVPSRAKRAGKDDSSEEEEDGGDDDEDEDEDEYSDDSQV